MYPYACSARSLFTTASSEDRRMRLKSSQLLILVGFSDAVSAQEGATKYGLEQLELMALGPGQSGPAPDHEGLSDPKALAKPGKTRAGPLPLLKQDDTIAALIEVSQVKSPVAALLPGLKRLPRRSRRFQAYGARPRVAWKDDKTLLNWLNSL